MAYLASHFYFDGDKLLKNIANCSSNSLIYNVFGDDPVKTGFTFMGWSLDRSSSDILSRNTTSIEANPDYYDSLFLYAVWKPDEITFTLHANGGTFSDGS
ncbi:MAG TPA: hypothetical protein DCW90_13380, partial [Lachnospiraceae bacterium]|nr:hypothetical protein [Lachnospiraceae bacterium]